MGHDAFSKTTSQKSEIERDEQAQSIKGTVGIDLAKQSFQLRGVDELGQVVLRKKLSRNQLIAFMANFPPCTIGLEACGETHYYRYGPIKFELS